MRILENTNFDFVGRRKVAYAFSAVIIAIGLVSLVLRGVDTGIDFQGGTELVVETAEPVELGALRAALAPALGGEQPEIKEFGGPRQLLVRTSAAGDPQAVRDRALRAVSQAFPEAQARVLRSETVLPRFAEDLQRGAIYSVIFGLLVVFLYVALRFEWTYFVGAVVALAHDVLFTLGLFSLLRGIVPFSLQIDQTVVAAFLTICGYSLNDTVIIYDRMREYTALFKNEPLERVINRATNSTLSRTAITGGSLLLTILVLFIFGGDVLRPFSFALLVGVGIGAYSSLFVAAPIVLELRRRFGDRRGTGAPATAPRVAARA